MKAMKIKLYGNLHSEHVQQTLFRLGCEWHSGDTTPLYLDDENRADYIMVNDNKKMSNAEASYVSNEEYSEYTERDLDYLHHLLAEKRPVMENGWYVIGRDDGAYGKDAVVYYNRNRNDGYYGWNYSGDWTTCFAVGKDLKDMGTSRNISKADDEDVLQRVRNEAKKRGFTDGCRYVAPTGTTITNCGKLINTRFFNTAETTVGCRAGGGHILDDGVWGVPAKHSLPQIGGYDGDYDGTHVTYGCKSFHREFVLSAEFGNLGELVIEGITVTSSEMNQVVDYINSKS